MPNTLVEVNNKLHSCKIIRQSLEQGQNKLRYVLELKEKVVMNTEQNGAAKIKEDTENLKADFEKLLADVEEAKQKLNSRVGVLEDINKMHKLITDWLEEMESNVRLDEVDRNDLSEKRALLEKYKTVQRDVNGHNEILEKFIHRLSEDSNISKSPYDETINKYEEFKKLVVKKIDVSR